MPPIKTEMRILSGTAKAFDEKRLKPEDMQNFDNDFNLLVSDLRELVDPQLGDDLLKEKGFYEYVATVAKGYFNDKPFGGLKPQTGEFGMRFIGPQDLRTTATSEAAAYYSWTQSLTTASAKTYKTYAFGNGSAAVYAQNVSEKKEVLAAHRLISFKPAPKLVAVEFNINDFPYPPYGVEVFSKISKQDKLFKVIPLPGRILLHPGGHFYTNMYFDLETGTTTPSGTQVVDVEVALFGLTFAEYDYLAASNWT